MKIMRENLDDEFFEIFAEKLEIQADGGDSASDFVKYCFGAARSEKAARIAERRAKRLRRTKT